MDQHVQQRIEEVIDHIHFNRTREELIKWIAGQGENLIYGAYLLARIQFPEIKYEAVNEKLELLRSQIWLELNDQLTALERIRVINYFLFDIHKYHVQPSKDISPMYSCINHLVDTKKGSPEILGILYQEISNRLNLPVYGIDLPLSSLLCYHDPGFLDDPNGVMFYILTSGNGALYSRGRIEKILAETNNAPLASYFTPCSNITHIRRLAEDMVSIMKKEQLAIKAAFASDLANLLREAEPGNML